MWWLRVSALICTNTSNLIRAEKNKLAIRARHTKMPFGNADLSGKLR